jgi:hypothetical protein
MKASSLFVAGLAVAILSIAPASAEKRVASTTLTTTTGNCSTTTWPTVSPVPCTKPSAHSYVECATMVRKLGVEPSGAWWWCSNQGFKN